ncbi:LYR motif-containing protein 4-like [Rhopilema esculentum]|uniref:LYR motif-containing protein 4-like n=1 Tax=Rhopilema esculentum TaxID=499914 RepID=UPI0031DA73F9|eukprot:gene1520-15966_t
MAASSRAEVIKIYRQMMRAGEQFGSYNFREYAKRRIRDGFKEHINEADGIKIKSSIVKAQENLALIKRQVLIGQMYHPEKLIIEKKIT